MRTYREIEKDLLQARADLLAGMLDDEQLDAITIEAFRDMLLLAIIDQAEPPDLLS